MICDVMPTISEDSNSQGERDSQISGEGANVEEMLLSILDERDRLMEALREVQEHLVVTQGKLEESEKEKESLQKQIADTMPQEVAALTKEVNQLRQLVEQRDEEITDLKAERNNTRLLLEHLECLVSRHERSLRMTVVKRQVVNPAGVSSEVEVLKALKSLFEHHKALDEKVRERLKVAVDKSTQLEEEVARLTAELEQYKSTSRSNSQVSHLKPTNMSSTIHSSTPLVSIDMQTSEYVNMPVANTCLDSNNLSSVSSPMSISASCDKLSNHNSSKVSHGHSHDDLIRLDKVASSITQQQITALQDLIDHQNSEILSIRKEIIEKTTKLREFEDNLTNAQKDLSKTSERLENSQQQVHELEAQRGDQEERIATLERRYQQSQKEISNALEESDKAKSDLAMKETELKQMAEKLNQLKSRLEQTEAQLVRSKSSCTVALESEITSAAAAVAQKRRTGNQNNSILDDETDNQTSRAAQKKKENIAAANELMLSIAEDKIQQLEIRIAEAEGELCRAAQRDKLNEEHNNRLTSTVSKLLAESNERLQCHLEEKMRNLKEKNDLNSELDRIRRLLESTKSERDTLLSQTQWLKDQVAEYSETTMHLRQQIESLRTALVVSKENEKVFVAGGSLPRGIGNMCESSKRMYMQQNVVPYESIMTLYNDENWNANSTLQKKSIPNDDEYPMDFEENLNCQDMKNSNDDDMSSPTGASDAKALALMIQEQLDAINNEIRLIQEEKETTEQRADELESRVGSSTNMGIVGSWSPPPPLNGRSTPNGPPVNWPHQSLSSRFGVRKSFGVSNDNSFRPNWLIGQHSLSTPHLYGNNDYLSESNYENDSLEINKNNTQKKSNSLSRQMDISKAVDELCKDDEVNEDLLVPDGESPPDDIGQVHIEPRHIRCESSPPTTPRLNRTQLMGPLTGPPAIPNQSYQNRKQHFVHHAVILSPQSSPSSGSQDSLHNSALCGGLPRTDSNNSDRKKSRLSSTLSRIFKKDRGNSKDINLSGGRLDIGSPIPSAVTPMNNFPSPYRHPVDMNMRGNSATLPMQYSHQQYYINQGNKHATLQQRMTGANNCINSNFEPKDNSLGNNTIPLGKQTEEKRRKKKEELLEEAIHAKTPFTFWNGPTIVAWLELWVKMPAWYVAACRANVKSGAVMASLSDQEIQREIGISNPLHRLKLRLAIQEMVAVTSGPTSKVKMTPLVYGDMDHEWIGQEWLPSLELSQYRSAFMENLVDARMLEHLTKRDLRNQLKMVDSFHRSSLQYGISLLRRVNYDRQELERRRLSSQNDNIDVLVWTHDRVIKWLNSIGLKEYTSNLKDSGLHGAILALDNDLDSNAIALMLQIPSHCTQLRSQLDRELAVLLQPYRSVAMITSTDHLEMNNYNQVRRSEYPSDEEYESDRDKFNSLQT